MNTSDCAPKLQDSMLTYEQALKAILENCQPLSSETSTLSTALKKVLSEPLKAAFDLPQFNNSAVDGYGVLVEDLLTATPQNPVKLKMVGEVAAGIQECAGLTLNQGECARILTGAPVPGTVEAVVMKENCRVDGDYIHVSCKTRIGESIRLQGEEIEAGATVLKPGTMISPPIIGLIATLGITEFKTYRSPKVAVIATGNELKEPGEPLGEGEIYNSNSYALVAALNAMGVQNVVRYHVRDDREETAKVIKEALENSDLIISAGGVSVGEYDYVKDVCEDLGVDTVFWRIAIKPGKPVYFGVAEGHTFDTCDTSIGDRKLVFGLPGNPVSALVTFNLFVKPAIMKMQNFESKPKRFKAKVARNLKKKSGRLDFVRGMVTATELGVLSAMPASGQESHMLTGLANANCLMHFDQDLEFLPEGEPITIDLLNWFE